MLGLLLLKVTFITRHESSTANCCSAYDYEFMVLAHDLNVLLMIKV